MSTLRIFKHYIRVPFIMLGMMEALILVVSVYGGFYIRFSGNLDEYDYGLGSIFTHALMFALVMISSIFSMGLYQARMRDGVRGVLHRLVIAYILGSGVLVVIFYLIPVLFVGRGVFLLSLSFSFASIVLLRISALKLDANYFKRRILVLGTGIRAKAITELRRRSDKIGFSIVGYVHLRGSKDEIDSGEIIKLKMPLKEFAIANEIDEIVLAVEERRKGFPVHDLLDCKMSGVEITDVVSFFERETGKIRLDQMQPSWLMLCDGFSSSVFQGFSKRTFDIVSSLFLLSFAWPFMLLCVIFIKLEDGFKAPLIYRQIRLGEDGVPFQVLKFRSMIINAENNGRAKWAVKSDSRITRVGRVIRKTRIDELPQILNVLKGDMSFVGPRPERPEFVLTLSEKIPYYGERHRVKPGITGWAQICYPYGSSEKDALEKLQFDLYYVKNYSIFLDLLILMQTAEVIIFGKGAR